MAWTLSATLVATLAGALTATPVGARAVYESEADIRAAVREFVLAAPRGDGAEISVRVGGLDPRLRLVKCSAPLETAFSRGARRIGSSTVAVSCAGPRAWNLFVPVRIQERRQVVVLAAPVPRGAPLRPDHLRMALRDIGQAQHGYYSSIEQALGLVSRRPLPMDTVLSPASVEQPRLVKRGQRVRIDAGNRAIAISATGLALRDGRLGEIVPVRNPRSERVIDAVVSDHGTVRVAIPGASGQ